MNQQPDYHAPRDAITQLVHLAGQFGMALRFCKYDSVGATSLIGITKFSDSAFVLGIGLTHSDALRYAEDNLRIIAAGGQPNVGPMPVAGADPDGDALQRLEQR